MESQPTASDGGFRACVDVARGHGLDTTGAHILRDSTNLVVDLPTAGVVARVSSSLGRHRGAAWLETELAFASHARRRGAPIVSPAVVLPPGPHEHSGVHVTFWERVDHDRERPLKPAAVGHALREVHDAVVDFDGTLPRFDRLDEVDVLLASLEPAAIGTAADLVFLRRAAAVVRENIAPLDVAIRPLHGDSHFGNVLRTPHGPVWTDLENACAGPIEYDLACLAFRERVHGHAPAAAALAAYGSYDVELVERLLPVLGVFLAAWTVVIARRRPVGTEALVAERLGYVREIVR